MALSKANREINHKLDLLLQAQGIDPSQAAPQTTQTPQTTQGSDLDVLGLTDEQSQALRDAGYSDRASLQAASDDELIALPGIGKATVTNLRGKLK